MIDQNSDHKADDIAGIEEDFVHLARLSLLEQDRDLSRFLQQITRRYRIKAPDFAAELTNVLRQGLATSSPLRRSASPMPVDSESRLGLAEIELPTLDGVEPIINGLVHDQVIQLIQERQRRQELFEANLHPTRTTIFVGPPGVGKTMVAGWIAASLQLPLLTLDLSTVMSSLLGRTGVNVRHVMNYAKHQDCVLLLDEIDAIAKRRDDPTDIGELKRLVTVLLQQVDIWPANTSLLIAATNHPDLLDPAIWRRFEMVIEFELPDVHARAEALRRFLQESINDELVRAMAILFDGSSFSDIESTVSRCKRAAALGRGTLESCLVSELEGRVAKLNFADRKQLAATLVDSNVLSQRQAYELTGVSRDTIRKLLKAGRELNG